MSSPNAVAIVPARGGSKRIPRKNIRSFEGVPLIVRTLTTLREAGLFRRVVVSTDDEEIAAVARATGADVPFLRSSDLADDLAPTAPVVVDAIQRMEVAEGQPISSVCVIYPAAVFTTADDLIQSSHLFHRGVAEMVMSATTYPAPILRAWRQQPGGRAEMIWPEYRQTRSQDLETAYHDAGQFYWSGPKAWSRMAAGLAVETQLYLLPRWRVHDIDTLEDWETAELSYRVLAERGRLASGGHDKFAS